MTDTVMAARETAATDLRTDLRNAIDDFMHAEANRAFRIAAGFEPASTARTAKRLPEESDEEVRTRLGHEILARSKEYCEALGLDDGDLQALLRIRGPGHDTGYVVRRTAIPVTSVDVDRMEFQFHVFGIWQSTVFLVAYCATTDAVNIRPLAGESMTVIDDKWHERLLEAVSD